MNYQFNMKEHSHCARCGKGGKDNHNKDPWDVMIVFRNTQGQDIFLCGYCIDRIYDVRVDLSIRVIARMRWYDKMTELIREGRSTVEEF